MLKSGRLSVRRWFSEYCSERAELQQSVGARGSGDGGRLWWRHGRLETRAPSLAPVQAIVSRFVNSPADAPSLAASRISAPNAPLQQRTRFVNGKPMPVYDLVFRACPLPVAMLL
jgi:hypothetical protein